jgi:hypothetical protein
MGPRNNTSEAQCFCKEDSGNVIVHRMSVHRHKPSHMLTGLDRHTQRMFSIPWHKYSVMVEGSVLESKDVSDFLERHPFRNLLLAEKSSMASHDSRTSNQLRLQLLPWRLRSKARRNALGLRGGWSVSNSSSSLEGNIPFGAPIWFDVHMGGDVIFSVITARKSRPGTSRPSAYVACSSTPSTSPSGPGSKVDPLEVGQ